MPLSAWPTTTREYPDLELLVCKLLEQLVGPDNVDTVTPEDLHERQRFLRVRRIGGPDDGITDFANMDVDAFGQNRASAIGLARKARQLLAGEGPNGRHHVVDGKVIDRIRATTRGPTEVPWSTTRNLRRFTASYEISARRCK